MSLLSGALCLEARESAATDFLDKLFKGRDYPVALTQSPAYPWTVYNGFVTSSSRADDVRSDSWFSLDVYVPEDSASVTFDYRVRYHKETYGWAKYANLTMRIDDDEVFANNGTDRLETATVKIPRGYHTLKWNLSLGEAWENWDYFASLENMRFTGISDAVALPEYSAVSSVFHVPGPFETVTDTLRIENRGGQTLDVVSLDGIETPFHIWSAPASVAPGEIGKVILGFEPQEENFYSGKLAIRTNAGTRDYPVAGLCRGGYVVRNPAPGKLSEVAVRTGVDSLTVVGPMSRADNYHLSRFKSLRYLDLRATDMEYVFNGGINNLYELEDVLLPPSLKFIDATWCFKHWDRDKGDMYYDIRTITSLAPEPPALTFVGGGSEEFYFDGLRSDVTVYVPASFVPYYQGDPKWSKFQILPIADDSKTLRVSLGAGEPAEYAGCSLELTDTRTHRVQRLTVGTPSDYVFHNLKTDRLYSIELRHISKRVLASIGDIVMSQTRETKVRFDSIIPLSRVECRVSSPDGTPLTDKVQVEWSDSCGNRSVGPSISRQLPGDTLTCVVKLGRSLGVEYLVPDTLSHVVCRGDNVVDVVLERLTGHRVSGRITDREGRPVPDATVMLAQTLNGRYGFSSTIRPDSAGVFDGTAYAGPLDIVVAAPHYFSVHLTDTVGEENLFRDMVLVPCSGRKVDMEISFCANRPAGNAPVVTPGYDNWKNAGFELLTADADSVIAGAKIEYPHVYVPETVAMDCPLRLRVTSRDNTFGTFVVPCDLLEDSSYKAAVRFTEYGALRASYGYSDAVRVLGLVYDREGNLCGTGVFVNNAVSMQSLPDGNYTFIAIEDSGRYGNMADIRDYAEVGLVEGNDYLSLPVSVKSGEISALKIDAVPTLPSDGPVALSPASYISVNKNRVVAGNYVTVKSDIMLVDGYAGRCGDLTLKVILPDSCLFVPNSLLVGSELAPCNVNGRVIEVPVEAGAEPVRFCVMPVKGGIMYMNAFLSYSLDGMPMTEPLGSLSFEVSGLDLKVMPSSPSASVRVAGSGVPASRVEILDDGLPVGSAEVSANGSWKTQVVLCDSSEMSRHPLYARLVTPDGLTLYSETRHVTVNSRRPRVRRVEMINASPYENVTVFDFDSPFETKRPYSFNSSYPVFTFKVMLENVVDRASVSDAVLWVRTSDGKDVSVPLMPLPADSTVMIGTKSFASHSLPVNVAVDMNYADPSLVSADNVMAVIRENIPTAGIAALLRDGNAMSYTLRSGLGDMDILCGAVTYRDGDAYDRAIRRVVSTFGFEPLQSLDSCLISPSSGVLVLRKTYDGAVTAFFMYDLPAKEEYASVMEALSPAFRQTGQHRVQYDMSRYLVPNRNGFLSARVDENMRELIDLCNRKLDCVEKIGEFDRDYVGMDLKETLNTLTGMNLAMVATVLTGTVEIAGNLPQGNNLYEDAVNVSELPGTVQDVADAMAGITETARRCIENLNRYPSECGLSSAPGYIGTEVVPLIDPSGFVYEAVEDNRLEGVRATAWYKTVSTDGDGNSHEEISPWDAESYGQENPLYTDREGRYSWDVPAGLWQVRFEKDGYEAASSEWLPVPPPQMEVNIGMTQLVNPRVRSAVARPQGITVSFDKYMDVRTLNTRNITVTVDGLSAECGLCLVDEAVGEVGRHLASVVLLEPSVPFEVGSTVSLHVSALLRSYAGCALAEDYDVELRVESPVSIVLPDYLEMETGESCSVHVNVVPAEVCAERLLTVVSGNPSVLTVMADTYRLDGSGEADVILSAALPGNALVTLYLDGDKVAEMPVDVLNTLCRQAHAPWATVESGSQILKGTEIYLFSATPGADIYYTVDGSCPCDESSRLRYDSARPVVIEEDVVLKALAIADGMAESDVSVFEYTVIPESGIGLTPVRGEVTATPAILRDGQHEVHISFSPSENMACVTLYDISGRMLVGHRGLASGSAVSLSGFPAGVYVLSVTLRGESRAFKVVKAD